MEAADDAPNGWPLGLGSISTRITEAAASSPPPQTPLRRCSSFSSFSSSNLDTESTASFFPDQSVPLGRLIGIRFNNKRGENHEVKGGEELEGARRGGQGPRRLDSEGNCTPLLCHVIARIFRRPKHFHALISQ